MGQKYEKSYDSVSEIADISRNVCMYTSFLDQGDYEFQKKISLGLIIYFVLHPLLDLSGHCFPFSYMF